MKTIYIYCEGPTEESFINAVLYPYFLGMGIYVCPIVCETRRDANRKYRGGVSRYAKVKNELIILCKSHPHEYVTTMFDYYAMPSDTPGISDATPDIFERIGKIESIINEDIGERNCRFHFMLHEFEGILFSEPNTFHLIANDGIVGEIQRIRNDFETPEHILCLPAQNFRCVNIMGTRMIHNPAQNDIAGQRGRKQLNCIFNLSNSLGQIGAF